ncbi:MAG: hypothetical protein GWM92_11160, partial [Gemmatimonadetes bacterium]|nr:hypothetical protein [Gemmatimonadota bacterium]NIR79250.1 hypothetical protein [Gemmatimonadota bacterium]NIT87911.1 hypothetical protein [Gemmatimonadota bacterium]NIU31770.1 hypothetical protein [Gemmatimonadota bacterium]NIU36380.1 hypothetical protein [Gemmatimonadota bacterium]
MIPRIPTLLLACLVLLPGARATAQAPPDPADDSLPTDSAALRELAEETQARFESYRESRIPPAMQGIRRPGCDERVGRFCLRHQGDEEPVPPEPIEVGLARNEILGTLRRIGERIPGDPWVLGHRVFYLGEKGDWRTAESLPRTCDGPPEWWCGALLGWILHHTGRTVEAQEVFRTAIAGMPPEVAAEYGSPEYLLDSEGRALFEDADDGRRENLWERLWLLSDPLYLEEGNDRLTAHWARRTLVRIRRGSFTPYGIPFDADLAELNVRYGGERGWERVMTPTGFGGGLRDTRRVIGRHHPDAREYLPEGSFLEDPAEIPPGAWTLDEWEPRTGYAAPYALEMEPLRAQVARFRRGDSLLVVGSYRPGRSRPEPRRVADRPAPRERERARNPFLPPPDDGSRGGSEDGGGSEVGPVGPVESGLFLLEWDGTAVHVERAEAAREVVTARVPNGEYVFGLEVREIDASRAWRTRQGLRQDSLALGQAAVSDLLFLRKEGEPPESLEEALPRVRPEIRVTAGDAFTVAWELYGMLPGETARVVLGFTRGEPGL